MHPTMLPLPLLCGLTFVTPLASMALATPAYGSRVESALTLAGRTSEQRDSLQLVDAAGANANDGGGAGGGAVLSNTPGGAANNGSPDSSISDDSSNAEISNNAAGAMMKRRPQSFTGTWREMNPKDPAHPLALHITQNGSTLDVSGRQYMLGNGEATASGIQDCAPQFRRPGYNYDKPGRYTLSLRLEAFNLLYEVNTQWSVPCDGHNPGTEHTTYMLQRISGN